jgi:hypothetical protein
MEVVLVIAGYLTFVSCVRVSLNRIIDSLSSWRLEKGNPVEIVAEFNTFLIALSSFVLRNAAYLAAFHFLGVVFTQGRLTAQTILSVYFFAYWFSLLAFSIVFVQVCLRRRAYAYWYWIILKKRLQE